MPFHKKYFTFILFILLSFSHKSFATESDVKKTHLEDIFIWKISDELKLSAKDEKKFTEIQKDLNRKKSDLNRQIQEASQEMVTLGSAKPAQIAAGLKKYRRLLVEYNQLSIIEFDSIRSLLGDKKFTEYLQVKSDLTSKVKSMLVGEKDKKEISNSPLLPPKIIIEKSDGP